MQGQGKNLNATLCGTAFALSVSIDPADLLKAAVMAATGTLVGVCTSVFLNWLKERMKK